MRIAKYLGLSALSSVCETQCPLWEQMADLAIAFFLRGIVGVILIILSMPLIMTGWNDALKITRTPHS